MKIILEPHDINSRGNPLYHVQHAVEMASVVAAPSKADGKFIVIKNRFGRCPDVALEFSELHAIFVEQK